MSMSTINDGGPANDMSLRAYFAGEALPSVYKKFLEDARAGGSTWCARWRDGIAQECFAMADAMLAAMERKV